MSEHWEPVIPYVYRRGALIERDSGDCGRWVNISPSIDWVCEECSKYYKQKFEATQDGITWYDTGLRRKGGLYEIESDDCCIYRWYQIPISEDYICDDCGGPQPTGVKWYGQGRIVGTNYPGELVPSRAFVVASAKCDSTNTIEEGEIRDYLSSVTIGDCVTTIGKKAFYRNGAVYSLKRLNSNTDGVFNIPDNITSIGEHAFANCRNLTNLTIPSGVTNMDIYAFSYCRSLSSVTITSGATTIGEGAFNNCSGLTIVSIPNSVTTIGGGAFLGCRSLPNVIIPDSVTTIGYSAFDSCAALTSVTIGNGITTISGNAFSYCVSLPSVIIPDNVTIIDGYAFNHCSGLTSVTIGSGVTTIGDWAFESCTSLPNITIPNSVTRIGNLAFKNCSGLTSVTLSNSITTIGNKAFDSCKSLTNITIPDSIETFGEYAFQNCSNLTSVTVEAITPPVFGSVMFYLTPISSIYVPSQSVEAYKTANGWSNYATRIFPIP